MTEIDLSPGPPIPPRISDLPPEDPGADGPPGGAPPADRPVDEAAVRGLLRAGSGIAAHLAARAQRDLSAAEREAIESVIRERYGGVRPWALSEDEINHLAPALCSLALRHPVLAAAINHGDYIAVLSWTAHFAARQLDMSHDLSAAREPFRTVSQEEPQ